MQPEQELRTFAKQIVQVAFTDEKNKELIGLIFDAQIDYGLIIARTFSSCLRAPSVIRSGEFSTWTQKIASKQEQYVQAQDELKRIGAEISTLNDVGRFRVFFWPYILIIALSFKFAKGVAGARNALGKKTDDAKSKS
jgi:hypothetical protein